MARHSGTHTPNTPALEKQSRDNCLNLICLSSSIPVRDSKGDPISKQKNQNQKPKIAAAGEWNLK